MHRVILTFGMRKSASTYCFQITRDLIERYASSYVGDAQYPANLQHPFVPDAANLLAVLAATPSGGISVRKTHLGLSDAIIETIEAGACFPVFQVRDPLDIVASLLDAGTRERQKPAHLQREGFTAITEVKQTLPIIREDMAIAREWILFATEHGLPCVDFEYVTRRPWEYLAMIASRFDLLADPAAITERYARNPSQIMEFNRGESGRGAVLAAELSALGLLDEIEAFHTFLGSVSSSDNCCFEQPLALPPPATFVPEMPERVRAFG